MNPYSNSYSTRITFDGNMSHSSLYGVHIVIRSILSVGRAYKIVSEDKCDAEHGPNIPVHEP